jgi:hypothetical protein
VTLWAWGRSEDLRTISARDEAVAYLDQTISISDRPTVQPRMQPLLVPPNVWLMAEFADQEFRWWSTDEEEGERDDCIGENCTSVFYGGKRDKKGEPREFLRQLDSDTARVLNVGLPMSTRIEISMSEKVPNNLQSRGIHATAQELSEVGLG